MIFISDALEYLSGGFYRATIHRVVQPPPSQRQFTRLGVLYFALPDDDVKLDPCSGEFQSDFTSQKFKHISPGQAPTTKEYRMARTAASADSPVEEGDRKIEERVLTGVVVRHYV